MLGVDEPIALGPFRVNLATTRLLRDGAELELRPQAFRAFKVLIENPGRLGGLQADDPRGVGRRAGLAATPLQLPSARSSMLWASTVPGLTANLNSVTAWKYLIPRI